MKRMMMVTVLLGLALVLAACGGAAAPTEPAAVAPVAQSEAMAEEPMEDMTAEMDDTMSNEMAEDSGEMMGDSEGASHEEMGGEIMDETAGSTATLAAWQTMPLVDARTGESFTLAGFSGRTVFVEPMATWCSNCRQQLTNVQLARTNPATENAVFVALSVETSLSDEELARYADQFGFDWTFAVATPELLQALAEEFGRSVANPPSTPHFVLSPDGSFSELSTGIKSPEQIAALAGS